MSDNFISSLKETLDSNNPNVSVTENGAVGYEKTGKALLDLNFKLSSLRNKSDSDIVNDFLFAYNEDPRLAIVWLFFARDIRCGCGERRTFRVILDAISHGNPDLVSDLLPLIPEYGRWDDLLEIICGNAPEKVRDNAFEVFRRQLLDDLSNSSLNKPISLLAKWVYSNVASSKETLRKAKILRNRLGFTNKQYRQVFSRLRTYIDVTEQKMSANKWGNIDYESVPSKAGLLYRKAFERHDFDRYYEYLESVEKGDAKMNAGAVFPYEIVHSYMGYGWYSDEPTSYDETLEQKWKNLPNTVKDGNKTLVVVDGSGSMSCRIGSTGVTCHDVARSLGIYFSEHLTGEFMNAFITFSQYPKLVKFNGVKTLHDKLKILCKEDDCSNTDIERTFDLILDTAVSHRMKQEDIPANILIISDMEFDACRSNYNRMPDGSWKQTELNAALFDMIGEKWRRAGYKLPRLVFWNVCSRTETIPLCENDLGIALVSGFSPMIADMVMSGELDPYQSLVDKLHTPRYEPVWKVVMAH